MQCQAIFPDKKSNRESRLLAFSSERPPESQNVSSRELRPPKLETEVEKATRLHRRESRKRNEAWERACEEMTDEQLLRTLGELHVKYEDSYEQLHNTTASMTSDLFQQRARQIEFTEEQLNGARNVWSGRKHAKQSPAQWKTEVAELNARLAESTAAFQQMPPTSSRHADERLKTAIVSEQHYVAHAAENMVNQAGR